MDTSNTTNPGAPKRQTDTGRRGTLNGPNYILFGVGVVLILIPIAIAAMAPQAYGRAHTFLRIVASLGVWHCASPSSASRNPR